MNNRRHIGYVLKRFPRISETFVAAEIIELERQGEQVTIFAVSRPEEAFRHAFLRQLRAPVVYLPHRPMREPLRVVRALLRILRTDAPGWRRAARVSLWPPRLVGVRHVLQATVLRDEMAQRGVTHAHAHFASTAARLANLTWRMGGPSYSVTAHAKDIYHHEVRSEHLRDKLGAARFVATVSAANRDYLESVLDGAAGPRGDRLRVIHNAVDLVRLEAGAPREIEPGLVLSVGRLVEKKGLADLITACGLACRAGREIRLEIVGDGPLRAELESLARRTPAPVKFHGSLPQEELGRLYRRAAIFSLPCVVASNGDRDGLPTSVLEAMALRVPVVTTAVNGLRELVVDGVTGLVVPERDPAALAGALCRLVDQPAVAERLAKSGRHQVEAEYSLERSVAQLRAQFPQAA